MKRLLLAAALAALTLPAQATLMISANINGTVITCADNAACDTNLAIGTLVLANQTVNGVDVFGSTQVQTVGTTNFLNTSSFQIVNHNLAAATIQLAINGINFIGPATSYSASGSGTWQNANGSNINLSFYGDPTNTQGATNPTDLPGILLDTFADVAVGPADSFAHNASGPFAAPGAFFGMSLGTSGTLAAWNGLQGQETTLVGRSQTILATQSVPEPGTVALLGLALFSLGMVRVRGR